MATSMRGILIPKYRSTKITPRESITNNKKGMNMKVVMAGIVREVMTNNKHMAVTNPRARIIGITASMIAWCDYPRCVYFILSLIY